MTHPLHVGVLSIAMLVSGPSWATDEVEHIVGPAPAEVQTFDETLARFKARVAEIEAEALSELQRQKATQFAQVRASYESKITEIDTERKARRLEAISRFEGFLSRYDTLAWSSDVRLRLAELLFQEAEDKWLATTDLWDAQIKAAGDDLDLLAELEEQGAPRIDLFKVIANLQRIIGDNRSKSADEQYALLDVAYYMMAFCHSEENSAQYDREIARSTFRELVQVRPGSEYADAAHLLLGNYLAEDEAADKVAAERNLRGAMAEFQAVMDRGVGQRWYSAALYQMAWAHYRLNEYDDAMRMFVQLLDASEAGRAMGKRASDYSRDAVTYLALSLIDTADANSEEPLARAEAFFERIGKERVYRWDVMHEIAVALDDFHYQREDQAIAVYSWMQTGDFERRPENPDLQREIVRMHSTGYFADVVAAGEARLQLTQRYAEGGDWWNANRGNPDAQAKARSYLEDSLLDVAIEVKVRAQEKDDPAEYSVAADKYREYLDKFPISDDYFENQWQLADSLYKAARHQESATEFAALLRDERFHPYGDISAYMLFRSWDKLLRAEIGPPERANPNAVPERSYASVGGVDIQVYGLEQSQVEYIAAADRVLARAYGEPPIPELDVRKAVEDGRVQIMYLASQILYYASRFEEARPRLQAIIERFPATDEAAWAANLLLNSYIVEKDSAEVRRWSRAFATMRLGASADLVEAKAKSFQDTLEKATFEEGLTLSEKGEFQKAAEAYLQFIKEFPRSKNVPVALLNAARNNDRAGRTADANLLFERFIFEYPDDPEAKPYFFVIASNYEEIFELEKAIGIYQQLIDRYPDYERAPDATYMVAFLKEGLGDLLGAAQGYEAYARKYTAASDREEVFYRAGALYERLDGGRALRFYRSYLATFGRTNPDHAIDAQYHIAQLLKAAGETKDASVALDDLTKLYDDLAASGAKVGFAAVDQAASAGFRGLKSRYDKFVGYKIGKDEARNTQLLFTTMAEEYPKLSIAVDQFVQKYASFEYVTAALYLRASAHAYWSGLGLALAPPPGLSEEEEIAYIAELEENIYPIFMKEEDNAVLEASAVVELAKQTGRYCEWVGKAQELLNDIRPEDYPAGKRALPGVISFREAPVLAPLPATASAPPSTPAPAPAPEGGGE